jgi:hypothetical protein
MANYGIQIGKLFLVGSLSVIVTIDVVVGLQALYYWQLNRAETTEGLHQQPANLKALLEAERTRLTDYRIVDAKKEIIAIPIERAMRLVVTEISKRNAKDVVPQGESR